MLLEATFIYCGVNVRPHQLLLPTWNGFVTLQIIFASSGIVQFGVKAEQGGQREHLIVCFLPTLLLNLIYSLFLSAGLKSLRGKKIIISESVTQMLDLDDQA